MRELEDLKVRFRYWYAPACPGRRRPSLPANRQWRPNQITQRGPHTVLFAGSASLRPTR